MVVYLCSEKGLLAGSRNSPRSQCGLQSEEAVFAVYYGSGGFSTATFRCVLRVVGGGALWRLVVQLIAIKCAVVGSVL